MKKLKLFFIVAFAMCISTVSLFAKDLKVSDMRIAVIWNPWTMNSDAPMGISVGNINDQPIKGRWDITNGNPQDLKYMAWETEDVQAKEISKAQLKFFLSALDLVQSTNGSLDTVGVPDYGRLGNVQIYNTEMDFDYDDIKSAFDGRKPNIIVYIGAGARIGDDQDMVDLLNTAVHDSVGVFFIGQNSVADARDLDVERKNFPIAGVQEEFTIKVYGTDWNKGTVDEFLFLKSSQQVAGKFGSGNEKWDIADTVILSGDGGGLKNEDNPNQGSEGTYKMTLKNGNRVIYNNGWVNANEIVSPAPTIYHASGEWSIKAKAVEVMEIDKYESEMNWGFHRERDFKVGRLISSPNIGSFNIGGDAGEVYVKAESPSLFLNGKEIFKAKQKLTGGITNPLQMNGNYVGENWFVKVDNDSILVLRKGQFIEDIRHVDPDLWHTANNPLPAGTPVPSYWESSWGKYTGNPGNLDPGDWYQYEAGSIIGFNAGGLLDLRITLNPDNTPIYGGIFNSSYSKGKNVLNNISEIRFKPYGNSAVKSDGTYDGRIQAGASIWAFNKHVNHQSFSSINENNPFDPEKYYADYLGNQIAGKPTNNKAQFVFPHSKWSDYKENGNYFRQSELPATSANSDNSYKNNFSKKEFHQIAIVQHKAQRLAIVGYQPTYLENEAASRAILHDLVLWGGYNNYVLDAPHIEVRYEDGRQNFENGKHILTTTDSVWVVFDRENLAGEISDIDHWLEATLKYGSFTTSPKSATISHNEEGDVILGFSLQGDDGFNINSGGNITTITVTAWTKAGGRFAGSQEIKVDIPIKQLSTNKIIKDDNGTHSRTETNSKDTLIINGYWQNNNPDDVANETITVTIKGEKGYDTTFTVSGGDKINFAELPAGNLEITITAEADGYVKSKEEKFTVNNNPDSAPPAFKAARWEFACQHGTEFDFLTVQYEEESDSIKHDFNWNVNQTTVGDAIFMLWRMENGVERGYKIFVKRAVKKSTLIYQYDIISVEGGKKPASGDKININIDNTYKITDRFDNSIPVDNPKINLNTGSSTNCLSQIVTVVPGGKIPTTPGGKDSIPVVTTIPGKPGSQVVDNIVGGGGGTIIVVNPGENENNQEVFEEYISSISAAIYDPVGNVVAKSGEGDNLVVSAAKLPNGKEVAVIGWTNKNNSGRDVGAGIYWLIISSQGNTAGEGKPIRVDHPKTKKK